MSVTSVGNEDMKRPMVWAVTWSQVGVLGLCCPGVYTNLIGLHCLLGSWLYPGLGCCQGPRLVHGHDAAWVCVDIRDQGGVEVLGTKCVEFGGFS